MDGKPSSEGSDGKRKKTDDHQSSAEGGESSDNDSAGEDDTTNRETGNYSNLERLRKQKRLAMNRQSARNRRKKKKNMMETLEEQMEALQQVNRGLVAANTGLKTRVDLLESQLGAPRSIYGGGSLQGFRGGGNIPGAGTGPLAMAMQFQHGGLVGGGLGTGSLGGGHGGAQDLHLMQQLRQQALQARLGASQVDHLGQHLGLQREIILRGQGAGSSIGRSEISRFGTGGGGPDSNADAPAGGQKGSGEAKSSDGGSIGGSSFALDPS